MKYIDRFFINDNYEDNPNNQVPLDTLHSQKQAKYLDAFDGGDLDITGGCAICAMNDYSTVTYPQIARFYGEKKGVIIQGKGVELVQPKNEIWYTSTDGEIVEPNYEDCFGDGVTIVSNTYEDGKGIIVLSEDITLIGDRVFSSKRLKSISIPDGVTSIGNEVFATCTSLTSVVIPDSVTTIGESAFYGCRSLASVVIPDSVTSIGGYAFFNVRHITYHGNATGSPWKAISINGVTVGDFVYSNAQKTNLLAYIGFDDTIIIPSTVTSIGNKAFYGCTGLTSVTIPSNVTTIGEYAFSGCSSLTSIDMSDGVTIIGYGAFLGCRSLTSVVIPDSVTEISDEAFGDSGLASVIIGNSVTSIGESAFSDCASLTSIEIPDSVTTIGEYAFSECTSLTSVIIGNGVISIGRFAFYDCYNLTSIDIPDSIISIGDWAFQFCYGLPSVVIPDSVTSIGRGAFEEVAHIYYNGTATGSPWGALAIN